MAEQQQQQTGRREDPALVPLPGTNEAHRRSKAMLAQVLSEERARRN